MKLKDIKTINDLKLYLEKTFKEEYWYNDTTDEDIENLFAAITNGEVSKLEDVQTKMVEIQTTRNLETMSDEELADLVDSTKDKTSKTDDTESTEFDPNTIMDLPEEEAKMAINQLSDENLLAFINAFNTDTSVTDGVRYLEGGYVEYAREVICGRAIPNEYDGMKPVQRRIVQTVPKTMTKNARNAGNTLALHPHGEASVYQASVLMTDKNGSMAFPLLEGNGNFGNVNTSDPAAAMRYTEAKLHANAAEFFGEMHGINIIPNFDSTTTEADVLPASFPAVLVNSTSGIAVGWSSNIPSFNFNEVCDLVIEYIKKGECTTVICPDFVTGGLYVKNEKELQKLMRTGTATLKLRAKTHIDKKSIIVDEIPAGQTVQKLVQKINDLDYQYIKNAYDVVDFHKKTLLTIDCSASTQTDNVLHYLLKKTPLQCNFSAAIAVIKDGVPMTRGVWQIIDDWVKWRRNVLVKDYTWHVEDLAKNLRSNEVFLRVVNDKTRCYELINTIVTSGKKAGVEYVTTHFTREEVPEDLIEFVATRSLPDYHDGGSYYTEYTRLSAELNDYQTRLNDIDAVIVEQMKELKKTYGKKLKRRTEITTQDFTFNTKEERSRAVDKSSCYYEVKNGFVRKVKTPTTRDENTICAKANSCLVVADSLGRLIRIYGEELSYSNSASDIGVYIPNYAKVPDDINYKAKLIGLVDGSKYFILYKDGYCSFVDTKPWLENSRRTKVISKGIAKGTLDDIGFIMKEKPNRVLLIDEHNYMIDLDLKEVKEKGSASRTKLCNLARKTPFNKYLIPNDENCIINRDKYNTGRPKTLDLEDLATVTFDEFSNM